MKKQLYQLVTALAIASVTLPVAAKVTLDDVYKADAPKRSRDLANNAAHINRHSSPLKPSQTSSGGGEVITKQGECSTQYAYKVVCDLADTTHFCAMSGGHAIGAYERASIKKVGNRWKMYLSRGDWGMRVQWICYKPS